MSKSVLRFVGLTLAYSISLVLPIVAPLFRRQVFGVLQNILELVFAIPGILVFVFVCVLFPPFAALAPLVWLGWGLRECQNLYNHRKYGFAIDDM